MRILAIRGENLASLAKRFEIDLTAEPLAKLAKREFRQTVLFDQGEGRVLDAGPRQGLTIL